MFTGIIETLGTVAALRREEGNLHITVSSDMADELQIDQSVSHNGVCLTVVALDDTTYTVTAISETLRKTNLDELRIGDKINLERAMVLGSRLDGHLVQGHVDLTARCTTIREHNGSWSYHFAYLPGTRNVTVEKGSITVDGVSLTVVDSHNNGFSVAIIPYTYEHTRFRTYRIGSTVNLEFDIIGKYVAQLMQTDIR